MKTKAVKRVAKVLISVAVLILTLSACTKPKVECCKAPVDYVNPYMGNISHLLVPTFPTIHLPHSLLRVYPQRYDFTNVELHGLPLIVTSHRGSSAFNLSPYQGKKNAATPVVMYSYDQEKITPYSYEVYLDEEQIEVQYGVSNQSAVYSLDFEKEGAPYLILNSNNGEMNWDGKAVSGYQNILNDTKVYLHFEPSTTPVKVYQLTNNELSEGSTASGENACLVLEFADGTSHLDAYYGISFIDASQAKANMEREVSGKSLAEVQAKGRAVWNEVLGKLSAKGGTEDDLAVFYTSLYRCYERPVCISEEGRYYSAFDAQVHEDDGRPFYTDDWIWDSYRAHHPLRLLIDRERESDIVNSFVRMSEQMENFWWPTFPEVTGDSRRMNSNHGVATIIDAHRKGVSGFDIEKAYEAAKGAIMDKTLAPWSGLPAGEVDAFYHKHGYMPAIYEGEKETIPEFHHFENRQPVAVTLGTAYDQWCLAELADELGKEEDAAYFRKTSFNYRNIYNAETKFFHPKDKYGRFIEPFDYKFSGGMGARQFYGENNGWVYRWDVQHNIPDLMEIMGGKASFVEELDGMFAEPLGRSKYEFYAKLPDHTGNVGQFSMANEPSLHIPYLYAHAGQAWKTQKSLRKLIGEWFRNDLMGVPGDEDGGGMSAFVVFSQMGFYPVTPGSNAYTIGTPFFEEVEMKMENGQVFKVVAKNCSDTNKYIQSATLNGKVLNKAQIDFDDIINGGELILEMGDKANRGWGQF